MEMNNKRNRTISYLVYLVLLFVLGWLIGDRVNINGLQEVLNVRKGEGIW